MGSVMKQNSDLWLPKGAIWHLDKGEAALIPQRVPLNLQFYSQQHSLMEEPLPWLFGHTIFSTLLGVSWHNWLMDCFALSFCDRSTAWRRSNSVNCTLVNVLWIEVFCEVLGLLHIPTLDCSCLPWAQRPPRALLSPLSPLPLQRGRGTARQGCPLPDPITTPTQPVRGQGLLLLGVRCDQQSTEWGAGKASSTWQPHWNGEQHLLYIVDTIYGILNFLPTSRQLWK